MGAPPKKINILNRVLSVQQKQSALCWTNSLWDEKKTKTKNRIVNQILLSKFWYIGQIYTIPKFIKVEIEKTIA